MHRDAHCPASASPSGLRYAHKQTRTAQVLVATAEMCWGMTLAAQLVVIMGTQYFDGTGAGGTDYPVTDLLQVKGGTLATSEAAVWIAMLVWVLVASPLATGEGFW